MSLSATGLILRLDKFPTVVDEPIVGLIRSLGELLLGESHVLMALGLELSLIDL
jgi:hypothetical protein